MQKQEPEPSLASNYQKQINTLRAIAQIVAFPVEIVTNRFGTWGSRYLGFSAVLGLIWPLFFGAFCGPGTRLLDLYGFWLVSIGLMLIHRIAGIIRRRRGYACHSRYWGTAWLCWGSSLKTQGFGRFLTDLIVFALGVALVQVGSVPLGGLLVIGCIGKLFSEAMEHQSIRARLQEMEDARIENEFYADLYRERHG